MTRFNSAFANVTFALLAPALPAVAQQAPPPPAPVPGSPAIYLGEQQLAVQLKAAVAKSADPATAPISVTNQYSINEVHRGKDGVPAIHPAHFELHYILEGSATFVTGGKIVTLAGQSTSIIEGGVSHSVKKGDAVLVPPNTPHWYQTINGGLDYLEVRYPAPGVDAAAK